MQEMVTFTYTTIFDFAKEYNKYQDPNIQTRPKSPNGRTVLGCDGHTFYPDPQTLDVTHVRGAGIILLRVALNDDERTQGVF